MAKVTETNEVLTKTNATLTHQLTVMQNWKCPSGPTGLLTPPPRAGGPNPGHVTPRYPGAGRMKKECPQCKQEVFHLHGDCFEFELICNADKRPRNWVSMV